MFRPGLRSGYKPVFLFLIITLSFLRANTQTNLVYNGGFEEYYSCPVSNDLNNGQLELCKGWWKPTMGTSDYFNRCNNGVVNVPNNFWGYQESFDGNGYVGISAISWYINSGDYFGNEYVQGQLIHPLTPCVEYHFEMQISFANYSRFAFSRLGALFTKQVIHTDTWDPILIEPQVINSSGILSDTTKWVTISGDFVAEGNEQYLAIGYFFDSVENDTLNFQVPIGFPDEGYGYYFIDNVSLTEIGPVEDCSYIPPNVITPNNDGVNDLWEFGGSSEGNLEIINRWGNTVYSEDGYSFSWDGGDCSDGVYYFTYTSETFNKTEFIQLIR